MRERTPDPSVAPDPRPPGWAAAARGWSGSRWWRRVLLSLAAALVCGALAFGVARGVTGALLFVREQQALGAVLGAAGGGLEQPPSADLRALRRGLQQQDARNEQISLAAAFGAAGLAAVGCYLWLELRA